MWNNRAISDKMVSLKRVVGFTTRSPLCVTRLFASTHFGYQTVDETEKQARVDKVFTGVARKYDIMNDAMSVGIHRIWKNFFVYRMMPTANLSFLDVCGGTGDIAMRIAKFSKNIENPSGPTMPKITVCDINRQMIEVGKGKANRAGMNESNNDVLVVLWPFSQLGSGERWKLTFWRQSIRRLHCGFWDQKLYSCG